MANFLQITPVLHVDDVPAAVRFFEERLGFTTPVNGPTYAYVEREQVGLRIMGPSDSPGEEVPPGNRRFMYYIDVRDVGAIYEEIKPKFADLPPQTMYGPVDQRYGQRELMVIAPDGNLLVFGQEIFRGPPEEV